MISDEKKKKLDGQLKFAVENMGPAYVAEQLRISVEDVEALGDRQMNWTEDLAGRMRGMKEHMDSLGVVPETSPEEGEAGGSRRRRRPKTRLSPGRQPVGQIPKGSSPLTPLRLPRPRRLPEGPLVPGRPRRPHPRRQGRPRIFLNC